LKRFGEDGLRYVLNESSWPETILTRINPDRNRTHDGSEEPFVSAVAP
jgi:hypothetical protein